MIPWVITREAEDAAPLVEKLRARGLDARCIPAIARRALPWPHTPPRALFFVTSPYAARLVLDNVPQSARAAHAFAAIAPKTTAVLRAAGVEAVVERAGGVVELARAVDDQPIDLPVVYATSDAGVASDEQREAVAILERRHVVQRFTAYTTEADAALAASIASLPSTYAAVFFSPSAVDAFATALEEGPTPMNVPFAVCIGASTHRAVALTSLLKPSVLVPHGADLVEFICSLQEKSRS
jgi:uroporphyrinogen-III synthase